MTNKANNSQEIEKEIEAAAHTIGVSADTFKRIASVDYIKKLNMEVEDK